MGFLFCNTLLHNFPSFLIHLWPFLNVKIESQSCFREFRSCCLTLDKRTLLISRWSTTLSQYPTSFLQFEKVPFPLLRFCSGLIFKSKNFIFYFFNFVDNNVAVGWKYHAELQTNLKINANEKKISYQMFRGTQNTIIKVVYFFYVNCPGTL